MSLKLYANLVSQPSRAVAWLLKMKNVDHEFINVEIGGEFAKSQEFLDLNPNGYVPVIVDGDFVLYEANAILAYLAEKFGWEELYPTKDLKTRSKINEYLHWHHTGARLFTTQIIRPLAKKQFGLATEQELALTEQTQEIIAKHTAIIEKLLIKDYVARTGAPTIADIALYCEYDQLEAIGVLDLKEFPKTLAWIARMKQIPYHDEIHLQMHAFVKVAGLSPEATTESTQ